MELEFCDQVHMECVLDLERHSQQVSSKVLELKLESELMNQKVTRMLVLSELLWEQFRVLINTCNCLNGMRSSNIR